MCTNTYMSTLCLTATGPFLKGVWISFFFFFHSHKHTRPHSVLTRFPHLLSFTIILCAHTSIHVHTMFSSQHQGLCPFQIALSCTQNCTYPNFARITIQGHYLFGYLTTNTSTNICHHNWRPLSIRICFYHTRGSRGCYATWSWSFSAFRMLRHLARQVQNDCPVNFDWLPY